MPLALVSELSRNLLIRTLIATAAVFLFLGFATGALPVKCLTQGLTECGAVPSVAAHGAANVPFRFAPLPSATVKVAAIEPAAPTLTDNEVVAASFAVLKVDLMAPTRSFQVPSLTKADATTPVVRSVQTVTIRADGTPDVAASSAPVQVAEATPSVPVIAPLVALARDESAAAAIAAVAPIAKPDVPEKLALVAEVAPAPVVKAKKPASKAKLVTVTGQGANVHAAAKGASATLFALAGGSRVSVIETSHGWVHITDAQGRSGWMYKDYLAL